MWIGNLLAWLLIWFRGGNPRGGPDSGLIYAGVLLGEETHWLPLGKQTFRTPHKFDFLIFAVPKILLAWQAGITLGRHIIVRRDALPPQKRKVYLGQVIQVIGDDRIPRGIFHQINYGSLGYDPEELVQLRLIRHELVHIRQWQRYGWTFLPRYIWGWACAGFKYRENPLEKEAYGD